jgi:hypothetical protein
MLRRSELGINEIIVKAPQFLPKTITPSKCRLDLPSPSLGDTNTGRSFLSVHNGELIAGDPWQPCDDRRI